MNNDIEHEGKVLNIDVKQMRSKLQSLKATKIADYQFKRYVFDTIPTTRNRWVRLRSDGTKTTLTVKEIQTNAVDGTLEWEVDVSDIATTLTILEKIGITPRGYQHNTREEYELDGAIISIDHWPRLAPYLEIEAANVEQVFSVGAVLGIEAKDIIGDNTETLYKQIGVDLQTLAVLDFVAGK